MLPAMTDDSFKYKLQGVLDRANEFLGYSIDHVVNVRDDVMTGLRDLYDELDEVRKEINEVIKASGAVSEAYKQTRKTLADAEIDNDHGKQTSMYQEAERYMRVRSAFEERERYLRRRRDDLERDRIRMERIMSHSTNTMGKLRIAVEVIKSRVESLDSIKSAEDINNVILWLQFAENENKRLAREIHDGPVQQFAAAILSFEYLGWVAENGDKDMLNREIGRVKEQLQEALDEFRVFLLRLQPIGLDKGLGRAIVRFAEIFSERHNVDFVAEVSREDDDFSAVLRSNIFRVIQEAANNALMHGHATKIVIEYGFDKKDIQIRFWDNGVGFDVERSRMTAAERGSFGLSNMSERVRFVNGTLHINSAPGKGTEIAIKVPIGGDEECTKE
jgi:two-component system sensor histidine kinase DegS